MGRDLLESGMKEVGKNVAALAYRAREKGTHKAIAEF